MRAAKRWSCGREHQADEQENCAQGKRRLSLDGPVPQRGCSSPPGDDCRKFLGSQGLLDLARSAPDYWHCTAEFNVLLRAFQHTFEGLQLMGEPAYWSRTSRAQALELIEAETAMDQAPHLAPVQAVLETALHDCSEVCISLLTFAAPAWLESWCVRWGLHEAGGAAGGGGAIALAVVEGYQSAPAPLRASGVYNIGRPVMTTAAPHRTIYIPVLPHGAH